MNSYVLSLIGPDRTGLVAALSEVVTEHGGNWERSQMTELAGIFAGVVLVHLPPERADDFLAALAPLRDLGLMDVTPRPVVHSGQVPDDAPTVSFTVVGADRTGIVREVADLLASLGVSIVDLRTWTESAAMAGSALFRAAAVVRLPDDVTRGSLTDALEGLSDDLMVDLEPSAT